MIRTLIALAAALSLAGAAQAAPQDRYATNNGVKIHYVVDGKGPLVVMLHGFPDYWGTWKPMMAVLSKAGYRAAALDLRGYNLSDKPAGEAAYAMPNLIGDVAAVIAAEGQKNAIVAGCDTIEHAFGLNQEQANMMASKGLFYDPTFVRYLEPYMDDNDAKSTGGKYRMIPIFEKAVSLAAATKGIKIMMGSGADGSTYPHGTQALDFEALVKRGGLTALRAIQAGTTVNAEVMGWQSDLGAIEKASTLI